MSWDGLWNSLQLTLLSQNIFVSFFTLRIPEIRKYKFFAPPLLHAASKIIYIALAKRGSQKKAHSQSLHFENHNGAMNSSPKNIYCENFSHTFEVADLF